MTRDWSMVNKLEVTGVTSASVRARILVAEGDSGEPNGQVVGLVLTLELQGGPTVRCEGGFSWTLKHHVHATELNELVGKSCVCALALLSLTGGARVAPVEEKSFRQPPLSRAMIRGVLLGFEKGLRTESHKQPEFLRVDCGFPIHLECIPLARQLEPGNYVEDEGIVRFHEFHLIDD